LVSRVDVRELVAFVIKEVHVDDDAVEQLMVGIASMLRQKRISSGMRALRGVGSGEGNWGTGMGTGAGGWKVCGTLG
jgi:hypothetical protein